MKHDHEARIAELQRRIAIEGLDALLVSTQDSIYYLTGASYIPLERPFFIIVRPQGRPDLVVPRLEYEHMRKVESFGEIRFYFEYPAVAGENWDDKLNQLLGTNVVLGIEAAFSVAKAELLKVGKLVTTSVIDEMRLIKTPDEIQAIRLASRWTDEGMRQVHRGLYEGQPVLETNMPARKLQTGVIAAGEFDYLTCSFLTVGWPAPKSAQPHSVPDLHTKMGKGPIVLMSFNRVNGYAAECERTVFLGDPTAEERKLFGHMMRAREIAYSMVKPGVSGHDIDAATQEYFASVGCGDKIIHRTGHGIGLGNHERPWISAGSGDVLRENMVISVEPAIYFPEIGGFRHSDTVLVTARGYEVITDYPSDLDSLIVRDKRPLKRLRGKIIRKAVNY